uniref:cyclin-dependent kinase inhibitor 1B-like n=1 Tax=Scatophagus argus TaxID=75038 RepID=UPI001ED8176E|nr:cyclin-dependent kinase inhibitor 1B-like [Scatophagus argus]
MCNKMSDVRLSNASPTLERVDARQPDAVRPPVRRNLFGSPDREELRRYFEAAMQEGVQDFRDDYNFDPVTDTPLTPRNYEWQEDSDAPEFFRRPPHRSQRPQRGEDSPGDNNRQDAEGRKSGRQTDTVGSRKRRLEASGPCSGERHSKRSHTDEDDDEDQPGGAASQAVKAAEERPSRAENSAEVQ